MEHPIEQILREFLAVRNYQIQKIKAGIAAAERGEVLPLDEVFAVLRAKRVITSTSPSGKGGFR